jgi:hypothetical protein
VETPWKNFFLTTVLAAGAAIAQTPITLTHVHGLAYSPDGKRLMVPSHHGLALYEDGKWSKAPGPEHDYMGFSANANHLYSSGHPAAGSGLVNPFGLLRSADGGKTWQKLGLEGESDFHLLATSWNTNAVYVWNSAPTSRMRSPGLHFTLTDGSSWKKSSATGLAGEPRALAVHPDNAALIAVATSQGLFLSDDSGGHFRKVAAGGEGLAVFFDLDGKEIWYGSYDVQAKLVRIPINGGSPSPVRLPPLTKDAVAYIAQNPDPRRQYAMATFERNVYVSNDRGQHWFPIAEHGRAK